MNFQPFQSLIKRTANKYGIGNEFRAIEVCQNFRTLVPTIFNTKENPQKYITPAHFKNGVLTINTDSPAWSQEIIMRKEKIIDEMNKKAGRKIIKKLKTQLKYQ